MTKSRLLIYIPLILLTAAAAPAQKNFLSESKAEYEARMRWWKEARFGMFIHWGLYAIPAGEWKGETGYGEWIRTSAQIPLGEYDKFLDMFDPVKFDAGEWADIAKEAGMKYVTITTKHHDGFSLFDSKLTDFDVMSTPFRRDIMKELSDSLRDRGLAACWYHSIMDWHHPDYLPRREWEKSRPVAGADFDRYIDYMKNQIRELLTNYGRIGVLWFDGEWETTWNRERGRDLYNYVRNLQPDIIINNRVGAGRSGMEGFSEGEESAGDFGTPEQQIPAGGLPDINWETCMTMNDHWGYNSHDINWKSSVELIRMLADIASKGGNFLLNVGPTAEGKFPRASIDRLREIGRWMKLNGDAIYGTSAGPFPPLSWGRCTQKELEGGTRLYLHVFEYPEEGILTVPGIFNDPDRAFLLSDPDKKPVAVKRVEDALIAELPDAPPDSANSVLVIDIKGKPDIALPPAIKSEFRIFIDTVSIMISSERSNVEIRYTLDGSVPSVNSPVVTGPIVISETKTVSARCFRNGKPVSPASYETFLKVAQLPAVNPENPLPGIRYAYYEGDWDSIPDFGSMKPAGEGVIQNFHFSKRKENERFGFEYRGYINMPFDGVYRFYTASDDGSRLYVDGTLVVDNNGLHGLSEKSGAIALATGFHDILVEYFEKTGGDELRVSYSGKGIDKQAVPDSVLYR